MNWKFLAIVSLLLFAFFNSNAQRIPDSAPEDDLERTDEERLLDYNGPRYRLPERSNIPLKTEVINDTIDGLLFEELQLRSNSLSFRSLNLNNWYPFKDNRSVTFKNRYRSDISLYINLFGSTEIEVQLDEDYLRGVLAHLVTSLNGFDLLSPLDQLTPSGYYSHLLRQKTFRLEFSYVSEEEKNRIQHFSHLLQYEDIIVQFGLVGSAESVELTKDTYLRFLRNLSVIDQ